MAKEKTDTKFDLGLLEGDDEFEEFPVDSAQAAVEEDKEVSAWEDNWDDDNMEDDFAQQLRSEMTGQGNKKEHWTSPFLHQQINKMSCTNFFIQFLVYWTKSKIFTITNRLKGVWGLIGAWSSDSELCLSIQIDEFIDRISYTSSS